MNRRTSSSVKVLRKLACCPGSKSSIRATTGEAVKGPPAISGDSTIRSLGERALPASASCGQRGRGLAEDVSPAGFCPHVGVAEPELVVDRLSLPRPLDPEERGHYRGVAPDA